MKKPNNINSFIPPSYNCWILNDEATSYCTLCVCVQFHVHVIIIKSAINIGNILYSKWAYYTLIGVTSIYYSFWSLPITHWWVWLYIIHSGHFSMNLLHTDGGDLYILILVSSQQPCYTLMKTKRAVFTKIWLKIWDKRNQEILSWY